MEASDETGRGGFDGLSRWLGLRWEAFDLVRMTIGPQHMNPAGLLAGGVSYAMVDYCMGTTLWQAREKGERVATINISINYLRTAREGDVFCSSKLDRRNDRVAILSSPRVHRGAGRQRAVAGHRHWELFDLPC